MSRPSLCENALRNGAHGLEHRVGGEQSGDLWELGPIMTYQGVWMPSKRNEETLKNSSN